MTCKFHHPELIGGSGMLLPAAAHAATMLAATQGNKVSGGNAPLVLSATNNPLVLAAAQQRHQLTGYLVSGPATLPAGVSTGGTTNYVVLAGPEYGGVQQVGGWASSQLLLNLLMPSFVPCDTDTNADCSSL
jgi:hypothetical protein